MFKNFPIDIHLKNSTTEPGKLPKTKTKPGKLIKKQQQPWHYKAAMIIMLHLNT